MEPDNIKPEAGTGRNPYLLEEQGAVYNESASPDGEHRPNTFLRRNSGSLAGRRKQRGIANQKMYGTPISVKRAIQKVASTLSPKGHNRRKLPKVKNRKS